MLLASNPLLTAVCAGLLGALFGSFLNVVILRLPRRMEWEWRRDAHDILDIPFDEPLPASFANGRSACPKCGHSIRWFENLPVLSWVALRGRCSSCRAPISIQYPLVEIATAVAFAAVVWQFGPSLAGAAGLVFTAVLIAAACIDWRVQLLPDDLVLPLMWLGLLLSPLGLFAQPEAAVLGAVLGYGLLWGVYWVHRGLTGREGLGYGDFKLLAAAGAWFGPVALLPILFIAACLVSCVGLLYLKRTGQGVRTALPFGPAIAVGSWLYLVAGQDVIKPLLDRLGLPLAL